MSKARFGLALIAAVALGGCGDSDESIRQAEKDALIPAHHTLGKWPNVVVINEDTTKDPKIDAQKTAADILVEIMMEAVVDADDPTKLGPAKFKQLVSLIVTCSQTATAVPISQHTVFLLNALEKAKLHTLAGWNDCLSELDHNH